MIKEQTLAKALSCLGRKFNRLISSSVVKHVETKYAQE